MTEYSLTLPYHMCKEWTENCVAGCYQGNNICQSECREKHPCGARDPTRVNVTDTATTSSAPKATFTNEDGELEEEDVEEIQTGFGDEEEAAEEEEGDEEVQEGAQQDRPEGAGVALTAGSTYGVAVVAGSMLAAFGLFL